MEVYNVFVEYRNISKCSLSVLLKNDKIELGKKYEIVNVSNELWITIYILYITLGMK